MAEPTYLTRKDQILGKTDHLVVEVAVPELGNGARLRIRMLSAAERDAFEAEQIKRRREGREYENLRARFAVLVIVDEHGERVFSDDDALAVGQQGAAWVDRVFTVGSRHNALSAADEETLRKN
jgi:hypothetical protein